ncbi:MAG: nuclease [Limnothrix sp. RL_2_0]|nr:nuclease [Limnothrix sp. RL_2_0]
MYEYVVAEVVKVVDGDTVDIVIDLGFSISKKERIRVADIDTPESRTRDLAEKKLGLEAKDYLENALTTAEQIIIKTEKEDKYGRFLGWLYLDGATVSLNEIMIAEGYAWPYDGGTKEKDLASLELLRRKFGTWIDAEN